MQPHNSLLIFTHSEISSTRRQRLSKQLSGGLHSFSLEVSIQADIRRLFHALTVPEYMEAWLSLPGQRPGCSTVATRSNNDYAIEHCCEGKSVITISGSYRVCRRRNIVFSWRVEGDLCVPETEVEIRLRGDFERTTLVLQHKGFTSRHDYAWHGSLWTASMDKLDSLYRSRDRAA